MHASSMGLALQRDTQAGLKSGLSGEIPQMRSELITPAPGIKVKLSNLKKKKRGQTERRPLPVFSKEI